jgi:hypothetical protein
LGLKRLRILKQKERGTMTLKLALGLVSLAAFAQTPGQNPMTVKVNPPTPDLAATKVRLIALADDPAKTKEILADDEQALAPILPYSVLLKNEGPRKLRAVGVRFSWITADDPRHPRSLILTLTAMAHANDPDQIGPGDYQLFTPVQTVNQYLAQSPEIRKQLGHFPAHPATPSVGQLSMLTLAETIQQGLDRLQIASGFEASLDGVVLEDYSYVGEPQLREILVRRNSLIH